MQRHGLNTTMPAAAEQQHTTQVAALHQPVGMPLAGRTVCDVHAEPMHNVDESTPREDRASTAATMPDAGSLHLETITQHSKVNSFSESSE